MNPERKKVTHLSIEKNFPLFTTVVNPPAKCVLTWLGNLSALKTRSNGALARGFQLGIIVFKN